MNADQVIGSSLRILKPSILSKGIYPESIGYEETILEPGRITPPVDSWIEHDGKIYWVFYNPFAFADPISYYLEHMTGSTELLPPVNPGWKNTNFHWILPSVDILPKAVKFGQIAIIAALAFYLISRK